MSSSFGHHLVVNLFGESHGQAIGVVLDNLPAGESIDLEQLMHFLSRRMGGKSSYTTSRREPDQPKFLSGLLHQKTTGAPLCAIIENTNIRSNDYAALAETPRPAHSDYPAHIKYGGFEDKRGGGHFSGRLTAPLCIAGSICKQILNRRGIVIGAHIAAIADVKDRPLDPVHLSADDLNSIGYRDFPVLDEIAGEAMKSKIKEAARELDSVGGIAECGILGMPAGIGSPLFAGIENRLAEAIFGLGAVRGIEFGTGFAASQMKGSQHNDPYCLEDGQVRTLTNHHGGILGGITSGMPILFRAAFKPTPSIARKQQTIQYQRKENTTIEIIGRHDPCILPRAIPGIESIAAIVLLDMLLEYSLERK